MNSYCTIGQFNAFIDLRVLNQVSQDADLQGQSRQQFILDTQAAWMESQLAGWYATPLVDTTTGVAPLVCTRYVALTALVPLLGRRLAEFPAIEKQIGQAEKWISDVGMYRANIPNVQRLASAHPALVSSGNMTGSPDTEYLPWMTANSWVVRPPGTSDGTYLPTGNAGGGIGQ